MAHPQPHSVEGAGSTVPRPANDVTKESDVLKAARFTLLSLRHQSLGRMAMRYAHRVDMQTSHVAYARAKECVYGPRFVRLHRMSQTFVMAHEASHHMLGHIEQGALLYRQSPRTFNHKAYNIACDVVVNWICENLPNESTASASAGIMYAVRRCQEMGIVNWDDLVASMRRIAEKGGVDLDPVFAKQVTEVNSIQIYHGIMNVVRRRAAEKKSQRVERDAAREWAGLLHRVSGLVDRTVLDPSVLFTTTPLELGGVDLHDALAHVVRTYRVAEEPCDHEAADPVPNARWEEILRALSDLAGVALDNPLHAFTRKPDRRGHALWNDLVAILKAFDPKDEQDDGQRPDEEETTDDEDSIVDRLADELNAHDDLREAIEEASKRSEADLTNEITKTDAEFRRGQTSMSSSDILKRVCPPGGRTQTPWRNAVRRMMSSALVAKMSFDHRRSSRRTVSAIYEATRPGVDRSRLGAISRTPMVKRHTDAKNTWIVIDSSGSIFSDRETLGQFIQEAETYGKTVHSTITVVFADAAVCEVVNVGEAMHVLRTLVPKGGGGTDFGPAIRLAEENKPDLIIYMTDLMGSFPRKPRCPIIWAFPKEHAAHPTPYGMRLQLS